MGYIEPGEKPFEHARPDGGAMMAEQNNHIDIDCFWYLPVTNTIFLYHPEENS